MKRNLGARVNSLLLFALLVLGLALTGCGGGSDGSTPAITPPAGTYSISGAVSGAVSQGVTINLTGATTENTTTDASGNYSFSGLANGSYTVTPAKTGYTFSPINSAVSVSGTNVSGKNFTATASAAPTYGISGVVSGAVSQGVTINLTGAATGNTTTDASGNYSFSGLANGSYTVTPAKTGYTFSPISSAVSVSGTNVGGKNFTATASTAPSYGISGVVSGAVSQGVTINLTGAATANTTTDASGNYNFSGLANGSYTVTPSLTGYSFSPLSRPVTISGVDSPANNFTSASIPVQSYLYFKRNGTTTPQTATLSNGTLSIDGKSIPGVYIVTSITGVDCFAGGAGQNVLTACWSPPNTPHTMLLCGPDPVTAAANTLLYVLFDFPDANRVNSNTTSLLNALQSETHYLGIGVYTDCSGSAHTGWNRNYPNTNYYLWPDVFTTYSSSYVSSLLSGAVIYSTPAAGTKYNEYVAVRVSGSTFEVWH